jgi:hypothetical protein
MMPLDLLFAGAWQGVAAVYLTWFFYLAITNLLRSRNASDRTAKLLGITFRIGELTMPAYLLGLPIFIAGYLLDLFCNIVVFTVFYLELPQEWTLSERLQRHALGGDGYRQRVAIWIAVHLLNKFDSRGWHVILPLALQTLSKT